MSIWFKPYTLEEVIAFTDRYLTRLMGIELTELGQDCITGRMPVDERTKMPLGLLHGGASCVLAETLASIASYFCIDLEKQRVVGLEINANHVRSVTRGYVTGLCTPLHLGQSIHVWDIKIEDDEQKLACVSRMTMAVLKKK